MTIRKECLHCPEGKTVSTGSTLIIYCPYQKGTRGVNDDCNLEIKTIE